MTLHISIYSNGIRLISNTRRETCRRWRLYCNDNVLVSCNKLSVWRQIVVKRHPIERRHLAKHNDNIVYHIIVIVLYRAPTLSISSTVTTPSCVLSNLSNAWSIRFFRAFDIGGCKMGIHLSQTERRFKQGYLK